MIGRKPGRCRVVPRFEVGNLLRTVAFDAGKPLLLFSLEPADSETPTDIIMRISFKTCNLLSTFAEGMRSDTLRCDEIMPTGKWSDANYMDANYVDATFSESWVFVCSSRAYHAVLPDACQHVIAQL
jgi:hypothetical protein